MKTRLPRKEKKAMSSKERLTDKRMGIKMKKVHLEYICTSNTLVRYTI